MSLKCVCSSIAQKPRFLARLRNASTRLRRVFVYVTANGSSRKQENFSGREHHSNDAKILSNCCADFLVTTTRTSPLRFSLLCCRMQNVHCIKSGWVCPPDVSQKSQRLHVSLNLQEAPIDPIIAKFRWLIRLRQMLFRRFRDFDFVTFVDGRISAFFIGRSCGH